MPGLLFNTRLTVASLTPTYFATSASLRVMRASVVHGPANDCSGLPYHAILGWTADPPAPGGCSGASRSPRRTPAPPKLPAGGPPVKRAATPVERRPRRPTGGRAGGARG